MGARFERYILDLLPALGLFPKASRYRIYRNGVEVGEIDILAVDGNGNTYAVEVKAGKIDISGVRQAYTNAKLIGCLLYTSPSPRDRQKSRMPSSA